MTTMDFLDNSVEIEAGGAGQLGSQNWPGFYWASEATAPLGAPYINEQGLIVSNPAAYKMAKQFTGWSHIGFEEGDEHYDAMVGAGVTVAKISHQKGEALHFLLPYLEFYPLARAYMNENDIRGIDLGNEKAKKRGYVPGDRPGISYGWRQDDQGRNKSYGHIQGILRVTLRGTVGLYAEEKAGKQSEQMVALPYRVGADGTMTPHFLNAFCDAERVARIAFAERASLYAYWENFYSQTGLANDADAMAQLSSCRDWLENMATRGLQMLPPYWVACRIGGAADYTTVGRGDNVKKMIPPTSWISPDKQLTIDEALGCIAMPYEISMMGPQMPWAVEWSKTTSTIVKRREQEGDRAI